MVSKSTSCFECLVCALYIDGNISLIQCMSDISEYFLNMLSRLYAFWGVVALGGSRFQILIDRLGCHSGEQWLSYGNACPLNIHYVCRGAVACIHDKQCCFGVALACRVGRWCRRRRKKSDIDIPKMFSLPLALFGVYLASERGGNAYFMGRSVMVPFP